MIQGPDRPGLLHALTATLAGVGVSIHSARVHTADGWALDRFELTDHRGSKLGADLQEAVRAGLVAPCATRTAGASAVPRDVSPAS